MTLRTLCCVKYYANSLLCAVRLIIMETAKQTVPCSCSYLCTHSRTPAYIKGSVALLRNTRVGTAPASCIPGVTVLAVLASVV